MQDCEFKEFCGGGHTTAQHHVNVYERVIQQECGNRAHTAIKAAVDELARIEPGFKVMSLAFMAYVMTKEGCGNEEAGRRIEALMTSTQDLLKAGAMAEALRTLMAPAEKPAPAAKPWMPEIKDPGPTHDALEPEEPYAPEESTMRSLLESDEEEAAND